MNDEFQLSTEKCILIFDIHQNIRWAKTVLDKEKGNFTHLLLGGDYFDSKAKEASSVAETCQFLMDVEQAYADKITILLGNHDIQYFEGRNRYLKYQTLRNPNYKLCGFSNNKGKKIAKNLSHDFCRRLRLFQFVNGYLISHAGISKVHWDPFSRSESPLEALNKFCDEVLINFPIKYYPILAPGKCRGGEESVGGITWQDWDEEFCDDDIPYPQIVGHTSSLEGARQRGRSWCLDGKQTCYGILDRHEKLTIKTV